MCVGLTRLGSIFCFIGDFAKSRKMLMVNYNKSACQSLVHQIPNNASVLIIRLYTDLHAICLNLGI